MQILDKDAVDARLDYLALVDRMEEALIAFSAGDVVQPVRQFVPVEEHDGFFGLMPAVSDSMGVKLVTFYPDFLWAPGETYRDEYWLHSPPNARQGSYEVWIRMRIEPYTPTEKIRPR